MNRPAGFSVTAAANAAGDGERAADRQRLVAIALEPFLDVEIEAREPVRLRGEAGQPSISVLRVLIS